jgi:glycosyltransferase involved in cell wall biosynthesis
MEAALCATPSASLAVGGLTESIVDGETGFLARDVPELSARVRELLEDAELRRRLGEGAEKRARSFTWDRSAAAFLEVLRRTAGARGGAADGGGAPSANGSSAEAGRWLAEKP